MTEHMSAAAWRRSMGAGRARSKFGNVRTLYAGRTYDSKAEARYAAQLDLELEAVAIMGWVRTWIPQVSIPIPGNRRMVVDFLVIDSAGAYHWQDVKGAPPTASWLHKRDLVLEAYGIEIEIIQA